MTTNKKPYTFRINRKLLREMNWLCARLSPKYTCVTHFITMALRKLIDEEHAAQGINRPIGTNPPVEHQLKEGG